MELNTSDLHLWNKFRQGDRESFERIYRAHASAMLSYGSHITRDEAIVEDCLQDLFVELWNSRAHLSTTSCVKAYLFRAMRYKLLRVLGRQREVALESVQKLLYRFQSTSYEEMLIEMEVQSEQMRHLRETLALLPDRQREAVSLRYFHNFSNEEMAGIMGIGYHAACKHLYAALQKLKENLKQAIY